MRAEVDSCKGQVVDLAFPHLTHLRFIIEPGAARTVMYAAMHGMHALQHLELSVVGMGCEAVAGYLSKQEFAALKAGLAALAAIAPLKTVRGKFQVLDSLPLLVLSDTQNRNSSVSVMQPKRQPKGESRKELCTVGPPMFVAGGYNCWILDLFCLGI